MAAPINFTNIYAASNTARAAGRAADEQRERDQAAKERRDGVVSRARMAGSKARQAKVARGEKVPELMPAHMRNR